MNPLLGDASQEDAGDKPDGSDDQFFGFFAHGLNYMVLIPIARYYFTAAYGTQPLLFLPQEVRQVLSSIFPFLYICHI